MKNKPSNKCGLYTQRSEKRGGHQGSCEKMFAEILEIRYLTFYDNISFFTSLGKKMENTFYKTE